MLAGDLIWEKSESASVDASRREPAVDEQRVEQFLTDPEAEAAGEGRGGVRCLLVCEGFIETEERVFHFFFFSILHLPGRERGPLTHTPTPSAFSLNV